MRSRGEAPAPQADPLALLEPGDDVFLFTDRGGRMIAARRPDAGFQVADDRSLFLGVCPFSGTPSADKFRHFAVTLLDSAQDVVGAVAAPALPLLRGALDDDAARERWRAQVTSVLAEIERGAASKIVLARSVRLTAASAIDARSLAHSMLRAEGTFRYLVREGDTIFAGASPERLVEKRGDIVRTEAVAGTAPAEHDDTPLDEREKDKREHLAVVLAIEEALTPHTLALEHAEVPLVRQVGRIAHLFTPFEGRVDPATHVLDLAAVLHPTPAVAGTPRDVALDFIRRHERLDRGWYAGPIGWFDRNGDGELAVALRCVRIDGTAVDLFAGAGIVSGSDADAEFDETVLKMRSTLASLGFEVAP